MHVSSGIIFTWSDFFLLSTSIGAIVGLKKELRWSDPGLSTFPRHSRTGFKLLMVLSGGVDMNSFLSFCFYFASKISPRSELKATDFFLSGLMLARFSFSLHALVDIIKRWFTCLTIGLSNSCFCCGLSSNLRVDFFVSSPLCLLKILGFRNLLLRPTFMSSSKFMSRFSSDVQCD